jgi:hypothetical protein
MAGLLRERGLYEKKHGAGWPPPCFPRPKFKIAAPRGFGPERRVFERSCAQDSAAQTAVVHNRYFCLTNLAVFETLCLCNVRLRCAVDAEKSLMMSAIFFIGAAFLALAVLAFRPFLGMAALVLVGLLYILTPYSKSERQSRFRTILPEFSSQIEAAHADYKEWVLSCDGGGFGASGYKEAYVYDKSDEIKQSPLASPPSIFDDLGDHFYYFYSHNVTGLCGSSEEVVAHGRRGHIQ